LVTLNESDGKEVLPAFYSDNYISLLPNEDRTVTIDVPKAQASRGLRVTVRGWNVVPGMVEVGH
jgi:hypothetical protein